MQTTKVLENNGIVLENVPPTQVEDDMSDIPGIRVSMATIVELSSLEEKKKLSDENVPTVSEKIMDEIFSNINTLPERQQQINSSKVQNQQELQFTKLTETNVINETRDIPPIIDITNETNENSKDNEIILTSENSVITENIERPIENITENINKSNENVHQNSSSSQRVQNVQSTKQLMIIDRDISQQSSEQKPKQFVNDKTVQVSPVVNETVPLIKVSPSQQLQQLSIPLVQNASSSTNEDVHQMNTLNTSSNDYKNVPSLSTLTTPTDTIKKANAIATKLFNNNEVVVQNQQNINAQQGVKRPHEDNCNSQDNRDEDSYNRRDRGRYDDYGRDSKRTAYDNDDSGGSGGGCIGGGRHRYGLGSEKHKSHYGSHYEHSQGSVM